MHAVCHSGLNLELSYAHDSNVSFRRLSVATAIRTLNAQFVSSTKLVVFPPDLFGAISNVSLLISVQSLAPLFAIGCLHETPPNAATSFT